MTVKGTGKCIMEHPNATKVNAGETDGRGKCPGVCSLDLALVGSRVLGGGGTIALPQRLFFSFYCRIQSLYQPNLKVI